MCWRLAEYDPKAPGQQRSEAHSFLISKVHELVALPFWSEPRLICSSCGVMLHVVSPLADNVASLTVDTVWHHQDSNIGVRLMNELGRQDEQSNNTSTNTDLPETVPQYKRS
jgi:hypothetical protein